LVLDPVYSPSTGHPRDAALALAAVDIPVFPCYAHDKRPATRHGFKDASTDPEIVDAWCWRDRLIGVPTGLASGISVLDIDPRHNGDAWLQDHLTRLPPTRIHATRSSGRHFLFQHVGGLKSGTGTATAGIAPGVDVRADGGYAIWWPAAGLEVIADCPLTALPPWPVWLRPAPASRPPATTPCRPRARRQAGGPAPTAALRRAAANVAHAAPGTRNVTLNAEAFALSRFIVAGQLEIAALTTELGAAALYAGLADTEVRATLRSAITAGLKKHRDAARAV
jgi:hypothetical protein